MRRLIPYPNSEEIKIEIDLMNELKNLYSTKEGRTLAYQNANRYYGINATMVDKLAENKLIIFYYLDDENKEIWYEEIEQLNLINGKYSIKYPKEDIKILPEDYSNCWVSPEGKVYFCAKEKHIKSSYIILKRILKEKDILNSEIELESKGWFKIGSSYIMIGSDYNKFKFTQKQIDTLFEIAQIIPIEFMGETYNKSNYSELLKKAEKLQLI